MYFASASRRGRRRERNYRHFTTSRCSRGVREAEEKAAAANDDSLDYRANQAVLPGEVNSGTITFLTGEMSCHVNRLLVFLVFVCFLLLYFPCHVRNFPKQV